MENVNTNLRFKMVEQNKAVRQGEGGNCSFSFFKSSITFSCYRCCYYFVFACFYNFENERNLPFVFTKKYTPTFSCPEKKSHEIQFGRGNTFLNVFI